jgi:subtilisin family serine protease
MCDFVDGQILLAAPGRGRAARAFVNWVIENERRLPMSYLDDLNSAMGRAGVHPGAAAETLRATLFACEPGTESSAINGLNRLFVEWVVHHSERGDTPEDRILWVQRNHKLTGSGAPTAWELQEADTSPLGDLANHSTPTGPMPRIAVLDSGISYPADVTLPNVDKKHSFVGADVADGLGHGTVIAGCIAAIDPSITIDVLKVLSDDNVAGEFDLLAALVSEPVGSADVVNLSLAFGLQDADCGDCGNRHQSSMSDVFAYLVDKVVGNGTIVVAAAGNKDESVVDDQPVSYPARFSDVLAVGSLDKDGKVLATSNLGTPEVLVPMLVFAPGRAVLDRVVNDVAQPITGTSMACAYVSAMLALIKNAGDYDRQETIDSLTGAAALETGQSKERHGLGTVNWPDLLAP